MVYVDPQKVRQDRERQERERQARLKAERDRQAKLKAEKDRQARLKAERDRKAKLKAEEDRKAKPKTEQKHPDKKPGEPKSESKSADPKKPIAQKPTETKTDPKPGIVWSNPGQSNPIYGLSAPTYSSQSFIHNSITPIAQLPETDLKPFAPLNRNPRTWTGEKEQTPVPQTVLAATQTPKSNDLGSMCLAPGASVATFGRGNIPLTIGERLPRTFDSVDAATAYARSLGKSTTVINEGNNTIAVYRTDLKVFQFAATGGGMPLKSTMVLPDKNTDQTNVKSTNSAVQTIITQDGYQLTPSDTGMRLADFAQGQDQKSIALSLQKSYASHRKAFGDGLQDIKDKDQFLKQYNLSLRDTAFHLLSASELDAKQKQQSFANGLPAAEAPKIQSVAKRLEDLDKQIGQAQWDRTMTDIAAGQSNEGMAIASLFSDSGKKNFEAQLNEQSAAHNRVQQLEQQRKAVLAQYPLLERVNPADFNKLSPNEQAKVLQNACGDVLKDIATTRQNIVKGKIDLMQLAPLVGATNEGLGIQPEQAEWVAQKASSDKNWDLAGKIGLGALALGLAVGATIFSGGLLGVPASAGLATAMGWGAVGVGVYGAISETDEYFTNQAGTNTNIDPNKSLMPQDMKGHWGWVVASWVGAGLDLGAAVHATRLLKTGMTVEEVIRTTSKAHNVSEDLLRGAYTASGKGTSDPVLLKNVLTSALPKEIAEQAGKNVDVAVLSAEEFAKQTGSKTGNAVTKLVKGEDGVLRAQVIVREGADPNVLLEEAVHVAQLSDPKLTPKLAKLTEENLANWPKMSTQQRLDVYKTKIELEIDAQRRLLSQYKNTTDPDYLSKVQFQLDNLEARLGQTNQALKNPEVKPDWLDPNQAPRLFNKGPQDPLTAMDLGISPERFEVLSKAVADEQLRRLSLHVNPESLSSLAKRDPKAIQSYARVLELAESDPVAREALLKFLPPSKVHIPNAKFEQCLQEVETFLQKYKGRVSGDFPERFGRKFTPKGDGPQVEGELRLAEDLLNGKTIEGQDLKVEGLVARKDSSGAVIDGEQLPEYRVTRPDGSSFIAEAKTIEGSLGQTNLKGNLKKAISQIKEEAGRTGEKGGYIRIDASASSSNLTEDEIGRIMKGQLLTSDSTTGAKGSDFVRTVEILYKDSSGNSKKILATVQDGQINISPGDK